MKYIAVGGKRADLNNQFFRSKMEANYARYLNFLLKHGEIRSWSYEQDTFEFLKIKRGTRFYKPDFKVISNSFELAYHEVKGWMDPKSKTQMKRMAKYFPEVKIELIDKRRYQAIARAVRAMIPNWE